MLKGLEIIIPVNEEINFNHGVKHVGNQAEVTCCMLDFAQLNLHEFGHGLGYLTGQCINPDNTLLLTRELIIYNISKNCAILPVVNCLKMY